MFFLRALGKCATRKALSAGRFLDKSAFLLSHGAPSCARGCGGQAAPLPRLALIH